MVVSSAIRDAVVGPRALPAPMKAAGLPVQQKLLNQPRLQSLGVLGAGKNSGTCEDKRGHREVFTTCPLRCRI